MISKYLKTDLELFKQIVEILADYKFGNEEFTAEEGAEKIMALVENIKEEEGK